MCNISVIWSRECIIDNDILKSFFLAGEKRGTDGFGYAYIKKKEYGYKCEEIYKQSNLNLQRNLISDINITNIGDLIIATHRSAPETECRSNKEENIQPIHVYSEYEKNLILVHNGAISNFQVEEMNKDDKYRLLCRGISTLDSEVIIYQYLKHGKHIKNTLEYLSGGFSFILFDERRNKLIVACSHNPLFCGYVNGYGMFWNSQKDVIWETISKLKNSYIHKHNLTVFEDYYCREVEQNSYEEIDLSTGCITSGKFLPRYITHSFDTYSLRNKKDDKKTILVACSGGLDSTTTLATLKHSGYDVVGVHFKYGHRGQDCEFEAFKQITHILEIRTKIFDIEHILVDLDKGGVLTNKNLPIETGTSQKLKTTEAWTVWRNGLFLSLMASYAESLILNEGKSEIYLTGGFCNLSESGVYNDNSERFLQNFIKFNQSASIVGSCVKPLYGLCNILKTEQYILLDKLGYLERLGKHMISCDRPKLFEINDNPLAPNLSYKQPKNCSKNGIPACGSGLLSYWACLRAGLKDPRMYYEIDEEYTPYIPTDIFEINKINISDIINKLEIHDENKNILDSYLNSKKERI